MNKYEFEIHRNNQPNEIIEIEGKNIFDAYYNAKDNYINVLGIVSTDPTIDLRNVAVEV